MTDDNGLKNRVRMMMAAGDLPIRRPRRMWGGPGAGELCCVCREPVHDYEAELEVQLDASPPAARHFHARCFAAWEAELVAAETARNRVSEQPPRSASKSMNGGAPPRPHVLQGTSGAGNIPDRGRNAT